jgi:hypothetical protein
LDTDEQCDRDPSEYNCMAQLGSSPHTTHHSSPHVNELDRRCGGLTNPTNII